MNVFRKDLKNSNRLVYEKYIILEVLQIRISGKTKKKLANNYLSIPKSFKNGQFYKNKQDELRALVTIVFS